MEIIGRLIMMFLLMAVTLAAGAGFAGVIFFLLRMSNRPWRIPALVAGLFPPAAMAYLLACVILSSMLSGFVGTPDLVFGDIRVTLPNGYTLEAIEKMPECGHIQKAGSSLIQVAWVGSLQVQGRYVLGKYDYTYFPRPPEEAARNYFSFDTSTGRIVNFPSVTQLEDATKVKIHLIPTPGFRGIRTIPQRLTTVLFLLIAMVPPLVVGLWLIIRLKRLLKSDESIELELARG